MKHRALVIDSSGKRIHQFSYCLSTSGQFDIYVLTENVDLANLKYSRYVKKVLTHDCKDEELSNFIIDICKRLRIDVVFGLSNKEINFLITYQSKLSKHVKTQLLPGKEIFDLTNDKGNLSTFLDQHNLSAPISWSAEKFISNQDSFPLLLKPKKGEGGIGILKCNTPEALTETLSHVSAQNYIIQEYIDGYDIDCSVLAENGKILFHTIQRGIEESKYNEFSPCAAIELLNVEALYNLVARFIEAIQFNGIAHLDLRYNRVTGKYVIIEINSRYWDTLIGSFLVAGINFPYLHANVSLGITVEPPMKKEGIFLTARAYFLFKTNRLKIPITGKRIKLKHSGLFIQLLDPGYLIMSLLNHALPK